MKYKTVRLSCGRFAVGAGKPNRYFVGSDTETRLEADILACEMSALWYQSQLDNCHNLWETLKAMKGEPVELSDALA